MATVPNTSLNSLIEDNQFEDDLACTAPSFSNLLGEKNNSENGSLLDDTDGKKIHPPLKLHEKFGMQRNTVKFSLNSSNPRFQPRMSLIHRACVLFLTLYFIDFYFSKKIGDYKVIKKISKGRYGLVKLGEHINNGTKVAIKIVNKIGLTEMERSYMKMESEVMASLDHPHIVQLCEVLETAHEMCMIMQYASGGDLFEYVTKKGKLKEKEAKRIFQQVASAIEYCHKHDIIHRDIKAENILLDENKNALVADWGFAGMANPESKFESSCGSLNYASPELLSGSSSVGKKVDIWALGVLSYFMVTGSLPFSSSNDFDCYQLIKKGNYKSPKLVSTECKDLMAKMLNPDPAVRLNIEQVVSHPWFVSKKKRSS